jgi:hypothetical protein
LFTFDYRNEAQVQLGGILAPTGSLASAKYRFSITVFQLNGPPAGITYNPSETNNELEQNDVAGIQIQPAASGSLNSAEDTDGDGEGAFTLTGGQSYRIGIIGEEIVDTRAEVPEPLTILGSVAALGFGGLLKKEYAKIKKKKEKVNAE